MGKCKETVEVNEKVLKVRKRILEPAILVAASNLALSYGQLADLGIGTAGLGDDEQSNGPNTLRAMGSLVDTYHTAGLIQEALELSQRAVDMRTRVLRPEHPETLYSISIQFLVLRDLKMTQEARDLFQIAVECFQLMIFLYDLLYIHFEEKSIS